MTRYTIFIKSCFTYKGDRVHISVKNPIDKPPTLHWHGMKLPAKADGGPHQPIAPNQIWQTQFDIIQDVSLSLNAGIHPPNFTPPLLIVFSSNFGE
jgi:FtsP/CotA-like multicopper oxidase with cupredoxin domain